MTEPQGYSLELNGVPFLDTQLMLDQNWRQTGALGFMLYSKPKSLHDYLSPGSCHPQHVSKGVIMSEILRAIRRSSSRRYRRIAIANVQAWFRCRGYSNRTIAEACKNALARAQLDTNLTPTLPSKGPPLVIALPWVQGFDSQRMNTIIRTHVSTTSNKQGSHPALQRELDNLVIAWTRGKSVQDLLG